MLFLATACASVIDTCTIMPESKITRKSYRVIWEAVFVENVDLTRNEHKIFPEAFADDLIVAAIILLRCIIKIL